MSPPDEPAASSKARNAERGTLGKYVKRMSTVFKRERSTRNVPTLAPAATSTPIVDQQLQPSPQPTEEETTKHVVAVGPTTTPSLSSPCPTSMARMDRNALQKERARALFAKYGLVLEPYEWITAPAPAPPVQRVEKSIRMRVHRTCHRCGTLYGSARICVQCEHKRCTKCPRYPKKKTPEERQTEVEREDQPKRKRMLTIRTKAGDELVYQPTRQRIRRACHQCETLFVPSTAVVCTNCEHIRCTQCPREPAKPTKWPSGYPGDADPDSRDEDEMPLEKTRRMWRKQRTRVRWQCDKCRSFFRNHSPQCPGCGHQRCDQCTRSPVKSSKTEEHFDHEVVAAVEAKLRAMNLDDSLSESDDPPTAQVF